MYVDKHDNEILETYGDHLVELYRAPYTYNKNIVSAYRPLRGSFKPTITTIAWNMFFTDIFSSVLIYSYTLFAYYVNI